MIQPHKWSNPNLEQLIDRINSIRTVSSAEKVSFKMDVFSHPGSIALDIFASIRISDVRHPEILRKAIEELIWSHELPNNFKAKKLMEKLNEFYSRKITQNQSPFVVISGLILNGELPWKEITYKEVTLKALTEPQDEKFLNAHHKLVQSRKILNGFNSKPDGARFVSMKVCADSPHSALVKAMQAFETIRGILNYSFNSTKLGSIALGNITPHPLNDITSTPYRTVHLPNADVAIDSVNFDRYWSPPQKIVSFDGDECARKKNFTYLFDRLSKDHGLTDISAKALRLYCRALDKPNWQSAFVELWAALEVLVLASSNESHTKIPDRVSAIYRDYELQDLSLNQMREIRNLMIHEVFELDESDSKILLDRLNRFFCDVIRYTCSNRLEFVNKQEWLDFLDSPKDTAVIERRISLYDKVIKFRS